MGDNIWGEVDMDEVVAEKLLKKTTPALTAFVAAIKVEVRQKHDISFEEPEEPKVEEPHLEDLKRVEEKFWPDHCVVGPKGLPQELIPIDDQLDFIPMPKGKNPLSERYSKGIFKHILTDGNGLPGNVDEIINNPEIRKLFGSDKGLVKKEILSPDLKARFTPIRVTPEMLRKAGVPEPIIDAGIPKEEDIKLFNEIFDGVPENEIIKFDEIEMHGMAKD